MAKRFRVVPGLRLSVNKKSVSARVGGRRLGATFSSGRRRSGGCLGAFLVISLTPVWMTAAFWLMR